MISQTANHRRIVGAVFGRCKFQRDVPGQPLRHQSAQFSIAGDTAGNHYGAHRKILYCQQSFFHQYIDDGILISGGGIGEPPGIGGRIFARFADVIEQGGLDAAEAEVVTVLFRDRFSCTAGKRAGEVKAVNVAVFSSLLHNGAAGVTQAEQFGAFVKSFTCGIVDGAAQLAG